MADQKDIVALRGSEALPQKVSDGSAVGQRGDGYGVPYTIPRSRYQLAEEGYYFICKNATPGTGVIGHAAPTTFDQAKPYIVGYNGQASGGRNIYLDYLKLTLVTASVADVGMRINVVVEGVNRYSANGADYSAKAGQAAGYVDMNPLRPQTSAHSILRIGGTCAATAAGATARTLVSVVPRPTILSVVGDTYLLKFGAVGEMGLQYGGNVIEGTTLANLAFPVAPVIVPPGHSWLVHTWGASQSTGHTWEFEFGWWER